MYRSFVTKTKQSEPQKTTVKEKHLKLIQHFPLYGKMEVPGLFEIIPLICTQLFQDFAGDSDDKESACQCRRHKRSRFNLRVKQIPQRRKWQPTPVFLPGKFHGQKSLVGYSPWSCRESEAAHTFLIHKIMKSRLLSKSETEALTGQRT